MSDNKMLLAFFGGYLVTVALGTLAVFAAPGSVDEWPAFATGALVLVVWTAYLIWLFTRFPDGS